MAGRPRLLVFNQYYWPGVEATAQLLTGLCEGVADTFEVTVITGGTHEAHAGESERNGVRIIRVLATSYERRPLLNRALNYVSYSVMAIWRALRLRRPDIVFCMTDPPFLGALALVAAKRFSAPLVVVTQDVHPEIAVELGRLDNPVLITSIRLLVDQYLRHADRIVAIGETMCQRLEERGAPAGRIRVIPNWVDTTEIIPMERDNLWAHEHGLADTFLVMHSGNVGYAQDLDTLIRAAALLRDLRDLRIAIVGSGARSRELTELAERLDVDDCVQFLPYQPREQLSLSLSSASVHFVGLARGLAGFVVPSRLYGVLAAGRPVIAAADPESETAAIVSRTGAGVVIPPGRPDEVARVIRSAHSGDLDLDEMGRRGREFAIAEGDRSVSIERYRAVFQEILAESSNGGSRWSRRPRHSP